METDELDHFSFDEIHERAHAQTAPIPANITALDWAILGFKNQVFGPLGVVLCVCGVALNMVSYVILRKKEILITGNVPLMALSICYMLVSLALLPLLLTMYWITTPSSPKDKRNTFANMLLSIVSNQIQLTAHTVTLWLGVFMAFQRLICINSRTPIQQNCFLSKRATQISIWIIAFLVICTSMPSYVTSELREMATHRNQTMFEQLLCRPAAFNQLNASFNSSEISWNMTKSPICRTVRRTVTWPSSCVYYTVAVTSNLAPVIFMIYSIPQKVLPCALMIILSIALVHSMRRVVHQSKKLARKSHLLSESCDDVESCSEEVHDHDKSRKRVAQCMRSTDRLVKVNRNMTMMLIVIIIIMVTSQLPPAIILFVSVNQYRRFGDFFDLFSLLNNLASFVLYCKMSATFRKEFARQFRCAKSISRTTSERTRKTTATVTANVGDHVV